MPRPTQNKLYQTFTKGLITEAGPLNYPENASTDELNTVIKVKGSRSRRLGIDFEPESVPDTITGMLDTDFTSEFAWKGVGNNSSVNFLVVQVKGTLYFYNMDHTPISNGRKSFTVDLHPFAAPGVTSAQVDSEPVHMTSGKGWLFVASKYIDPVLIDYDASSDSVSTLKIIIQIRDFDGVDDSLGNEDQPATLTKEHLYNLRNQGWVTPGPNGVLEGAGTANPYTAPTGPETTKEVYISSRTGTYNTSYL